MSRLPDIDLDETLWEGQLELLDTGDVRDDPEHAPLDPRALPAVAMGTPSAWPLTEVYPSGQMPPAMRARLAANDFYLVALHCSFRPLRDEVQIEWARFVVELLGDGPGAAPEAEAIHPEKIEDEVGRNRRITLSPSLGFVGIDVGLGEVAFGIEYKALEPRVWGARDPATSPSWDYQPTRGHRLYGSRQMHLLVRASLGAQRLLGRLHLVADVSHERRLVGRAKARRDQSPLDVTLWPR